jgi:hypothetical protein
MRKEPGPVVSVVRKFVTETELDPEVPLDLTSFSLICEVHSLESKRYLFFPNLGSFPVKLNQSTLELLRVVKGALEVKQRDTSAILAYLDYNNLEILER